MIPTLLRAEERKFMVPDRWQHFLADRLGLYVVFGVWEAERK